MEEEPQIKIALEPSKYAKIRQAFLDTCTIPTLKEAKYMLGKFADFIYEECDEGLKHFIKSYQWPPYGDMWISPSDLLIKKMVLKAPPTRMHMEAITHEGAIKIGWGIEQKFLRYLKKDKLQALEEQRKTMTENFDKSIEHQIKDAQLREKNACLDETKELMEGFDKRLMQELKEITRKLQKEYDILTTNHDVDTKREWEAKIKSAVEETTRNITEQFLEELSQQEAAMAMHFKNELTKREIKRKFEIEKLESEFKKTFHSVKHRIECRNIANMMYILCMERHKCSEEQEIVEKYYKKRTHELTTLISMNKQSIDNLRNEINDQMRKLKLRETCILEIIKQYQNFIKVALKKTPKKAKFLLSIDKLLLFELTDTLSKIKPCLNAQVITNEDVEEEKDDMMMTKIAEDWEEFYATKKETPAFVLEDKLYIKEDFEELRKMWSKTVELYSNHEIWTHDVGVYLEVLKESIPPALKYTPSKLYQFTNSVFPKDKKEKIHPHRSSFIQFKLSQDSSPCKDLVKLVKLDKPHPLTKKNKTELKTLKYTQTIGDILSPIDYSKLGISETNPCLLSTKSSLELMLQKTSGKAYRSQEAIKEDKDYSETGEFQIKAVIPEYETMSEYGRTSMELQEKQIPHTINRISFGSAKSEVMPLGIRDSVILRQSSLAKQKTRSFTLSPKDSIEVKQDSVISALLRKKSSKLLSTKDSLTQLKEPKSTAICSICHKEDQSQTFQKDYCCARCSKKDSIELVTVNGVFKKTKMPDKDDQTQQQKEIRISHVEIIEMDTESTPKVFFVPEPTLVEEIAHPKELGKMYKPSKTTKRESRRPSVDPCRSVYKSLIRIEGDTTTNQHLQDNNEFTKERIRSFISLMTDHPNLVNLFTSCQQ